MKRSIFKPLLSVLGFSILCFFVHYCILIYLIGQEALSNFYFSLRQIYVFFTISSFLIITTLIFVRKRNLDIVGYFYMVLTILKMGVAYFFLHQINKNPHDFLSYEKNSFFLSFILYLAIETLITVRILNKNQ